MTPDTLLTDAKAAADRHIAATFKLGECKIAKAAAEVAVREAKNTVLLSLTDPAVEKEFGRNEPLRNARLESELADLFADLRAAEVALMHAEMEEKSARISADLVGTQVQLLNLRSRYQNA